MALQSIKRGRVLPTLGYEVPEWFRQFMMIDIVPALQQLDQLHTAFQAYQLPVVAGAMSKMVVLTTPYPDALYSPLITPDWNTTVWVTSPILTTGFTANFGNAVPGGGGTIRVLTVR